MFRSWTERQTVLHPEHISQLNGLNRKTLSIVILLIRLSHFHQSLILHISSKLLSFKILLIVWVSHKGLIEQ